MDEQPASDLVTGRTYRAAVPLLIWGAHLNNHSGPERGPLKWLPPGTLFRVADVFPVGTTPVAKVEVIEGRTPEPGDDCVFASSGAACHDETYAPTAAVGHEGTATPITNVLIPGRTYRCLQPVPFWAVDRITSSGPSRSRDMKLPTGSKFHVRAVYELGGIGVAEIDIVDGKPDVSDCGLECDTGDYFTYAASARKCEMIAPPPDEYPPGVYRCTRDVEVALMDFDKVCSEVRTDTLPTGTLVRVAPQVYFGENNPLLYRHYTLDLAADPEHAPDYGFFLSLSELAAGCEFVSAPPPEDAR